MTRAYVARALGVVLTAGAVVVATSPPAAAAQGITTRESVDSSGGQANAASFAPSVSADGRYVAYDSDATDLVPGDTNGVADVFVRDRDTGTTTRVSVGSAGVQGNGGSFDPSISADGRYVAFESSATNLVSGDTNGNRDAFVHDRLTGATTRVSVTSSGGQANDDSGDPAISADGRYVAFDSLANDLDPGDSGRKADVFVHDRLTGATTRESVDGSGNPGNDWSVDPDISDDGRYVVFDSWSSNLVAGDAGRKLDVFVRDRVTGTVTWVSVTPSGAGGNAESFDTSISADGRYVAFSSGASDLVSGDTNNAWDIFVRDLVAGTTARVSVGSVGTLGNSHSQLPSISADGQVVAFESLSTNLVSGDTNASRDAFVKFLDTGETHRASVTSGGAQALGTSEKVSLSGDGRFVAFESLATNLVSGDTNGVRDVFVHRPLRPPSRPTLVSPPDGHDFGSNDPQVFTIRSTDPDGDPYHGVVTVTDALTGSTVTTFSTATVASGVDSSGTPPSPIPPGSYRWTAVAVDATGATSTRSLQRTFRVLPVPTNEAPSVPTLIAPTPGETFLFGSPTRFTLNAVDPEGLPYRGLVTVLDAAGDIVAEFETVPAPSGEDTTGTPPEFFTPGSYTWTARAVDVHGLAGPEAPPRSFHVEPADPPGLSLL